MVKGIIIVIFLLNASISSACHFDWTGQELLGLGDESSGNWRYFKLDGELLFNEGIPQDVGFGTSGFFRGDINDTEKYVTTITFDINYEIKTDGNMGVDTIIRIYDLTNKNDFFRKTTRLIGNNGFYQEKISTVFNHDTEYYFDIFISSDRLEEEKYAMWSTMDTVDLDIYYYANISCSSISTQPIPEPTTIVLFGAGLLGVAGFSRRKK